MPSTLDATAYPHLLDAVIARASPSVLLKLRATSRHCKSRADARLAAHLLLEDRGMGGRWFAAWHASLNLSLLARPVSSTFNTYSVSMHVRRLRALGAPPTDTHYNWTQFLRARAPFVRGPGEYLPLVRVLDLRGDIGVLDDTLAFTHEVPLTRLIAGQSGEMQERPPHSRTLALFPDPESIASGHVSIIGTRYRKVVVNVGWHDAPGLARVRFDESGQEAWNVRELVISFVGWEAGKGMGSRRRGTVSSVGMEWNMDSPVQLEPCTGMPQDEEREEEQDTLPWIETEPRVNDNLRWQELAYLVALGVGSGARVTVVDLERVDPAWLDPSFATPAADADASNPDPVSVPVHVELGRRSLADDDGASNDSTFTADRLDDLINVPPTAYSSAILSDLKATLRGLRVAHKPSFWLANGLRMPDLFTMVRSWSTTGSVRFLTAKQYAAEAGRLETDANVFAV
ncbi:hypothetical protein CspeluHIS016_0101530 [Cutaneotrichosporon spelunceum]|uniref:Uncharacterized protein n=1 Tax=Cutaneotrichosporon spelunceum TaxID=1672016 RepID=A0AAD3TN04_9TREE|nr:hypothetical protein CspeluHIS016_0101530 [Cutaneotrichosporon spelunceum]